VSKTANFWKSPSQVSQQEQALVVANSFSLGLDPKTFRSVDSLPAINSPVYTIQSSTARVKPKSRADMLYKYPIGFIGNGRWEPTDIASVSAGIGPHGWSQRAMVQSIPTKAQESIGQWRYEQSVKERNYALAATTPVLGQYAPTYGWPVSP
jgi:hypothetical protein